MNLQSLEKYVICEYDNRFLKSRVRYNELSKIVCFLTGKYGNSIDCLSKGKEALKREYELSTGKPLNSAASSAFNELFNQYSLHGGETIVESAKPVISVKSKDDRDETYVIDLCDEVLGQRAARQYRFPFLLGDSGTALPVDAYYKELSLVIEYCERQHTEAVPFFDRRITASGVSRGEQRRIYDKRRREVLPQHGIRIVNISYSDFEFDSRKRIIRNRARDILVVKKILDL